MNTDHLDPVTISVPTALKLSGLGRTKLYELIAMKQIRSVRVGARRLIDFASLKSFLTSQEACPDRHDSQTRPMSEYEGVTVLAGTFPSEESAKLDVATNCLPRIRDLTGGTGRRTHKQRCLT